MNHEVSCYAIIVVLNFSCHRLHIFNNICAKITPTDLKKIYTPSLKIT